MDTLLKAIQTAIKTAPTMDYLKGSVEIIPEGPDDDVLPSEAKFPLVGITDGAESIEHLPGKKKETFREVRISGYEEIMRPERAIVGDDVNRGVIKIIKDAQAVLEHNLLNLPGYTIARSVSVEASTVVPLANLLAAKKTIIFRYKARL